MFKLNFRSVHFNLSGLLVLLTFTFLLVTGLANQAKAADISVNIEAGGAIAGNNATVDTFLIDATNDGEGANAAITLGIGNAGLTVSSDGADATGVADQGEIASFTSTDNTGTATLTLNDATNGDFLRLVVTGDISGDVATDANDLNIIINATATNDAGGTQLTSRGNITLGTGTITLNSDADDIAILNLNGSGAQSVTGVINGAATGEGEVINAKTGGTLTFNSNIGSGTSVNRVRLDVNFATTFNGTVSAATDININNTSTATFNGNITTASLNFAQDGTAIIAAGVNITGAVNNTTTNEGTLTLSGATTISGAVGSTGAGLKLINAGANSTTAVFNGLVTTTSLTTTGTGNININAGLTGGLSFATNATVAVAANQIITGNVSATGAGQGTLNFTATTSNSTLVSGTTGGANTINVVTVAPSSGITATFTGAYDVVTTTHSGAGTVTFGNTVGANASSNINISAGGIVRIAGVVGAGGASNVDNTSGGAGSGTLVLTGTATNFTGNIGASNSLASVTIDSTGGTSTITGSVAATTVTLSGTGTTAFTNNNVTGNINFSANGTATFTADELITGAVTTSTNNTGTLTFATSAANTTVVSGNIGVSGTALTQVQAGAAAGQTATFSGNIFATTVTVANGAATGTVAFGGSVTATTLNFSANGIATLAGGQNITAAVTTGTNNTGTLTFLGSSTMTGDIATNGAVLNAVNINGSGNTVTLTGDLHATTTTIANLATLSFTKAATTVTGAITAAGTTGTLNVGTATVTPSGTVTLGANAKLGVTIGTTNGQLNASAAGATFASGTAIVPTVSGSLAAGDIIIVQDNDGNVGLGVGVTTGLTVTDNSSQFNFTLKITGNNLVLTVIDTGSSAGLSSNSAAVNNVTTAAFSGDTAMTNALGALSGTAKDEALKTLQPEANGGGVAGAFSAGGATSSSVSTRTASLRTGISAGQGLNAGDGISDEKHFWFQGFGTYADQGTRQGVTGFTSVTGGFAMGADKQVSHDLLVGMAGSFAYSDVNSSLSQNRTVVESYQGTLYGSREFGKYFIDAQVGLAYNDYTGDRFITVGAVERTAHADYSGYQVSGLVEVGREMSLPKQVKFTPILGLGYTHVGIPEYTETDAGTSNLNVKGQDYDILNVSFRGEFRRTYEMAEGSLTPEFKIGYNYEALDNPIQNISSFTGGGSAFETVGFDPENHSYLAGAGVTFESTNNFDFIAKYDLVSKTDFNSHSFLLKGRWNF